MWKIVQGLKQGSPEWVAHRANHFNASDAPAMMACHPSKTRSELVRELATGIGREFSSFVQERILDKGHEFERLAGPLMEELVGEPLFPVVGTNGKYSASYDGMTMGEDIAAEHKRLNAALREAMVPGCTGADLPLCYQVQMEDQAMVCPTIERVLFVASEWDDSGKLIEARHCWYTPNPELRAKIVTGWEMLEKDVAAYVPPKAEPVAAKIQAALPALRIEASGEITASNLDEFQVVVLDRINSVNMELVTDQDFAEGAADAEWLRDVSKKMKKAVEHVRGGMQSVDEVLRVLERLDEIATQKAIAIEKKVKSEKDVRKEQIVMKAENDLAAHITGLNEKLGASYIALPRGIFAPVIKGLKSLQSMEDKVKAALAGAMTDADGAAARLAANRAHLKHEDQDWITLFPDFASVGAKAAEDFHALAALRIGNHKQAEADRLEKIRKEEAERLEKEQAEQAAKETPAPAQQAPAAINSGSAELPFHPAAAQAGIPEAAPADDGATLSLVQINTELAKAGVKIDAAGITLLGFEFKQERGKVLFPKAKFAALCRTIAGNVLELPRRD